MKFFTALLGLFALVSTATAFATCPVCPPCKCFLKENPAPLAHYAQWHCRLKSHLLWDTYTLKGTNWLVGEDEIHRTCKKAGIVTQWEYEAHTNQEDKVEFVATVSTHTATSSSYTYT